MKKIVSLSIALLLVAALAVTAFAANVSEQGWFGDNDNTTGWEIADGTITNDRTSGGTTHRVMKEVLLDADNYEVSIDVTAGPGSSPYIKVREIRIDMDTRGGNGNQFFPKYLHKNNWTNFGGNWVDGMTATLKLSRVNGGDVTITLTAGSTVLTQTLSAVECDSLLVEIGNDIDGTTASFTNIVVPQAPADPEPENPKTGDMVSVAVALLAVSGIALAVLKKKD